MRIAVDAMGGDHAPQEIVKGAILSAEAYSDITIVLYGDESKIRSHMDRELSNVEVVHSTDVITNEDDPVRSIRRKKESSMVMATKSVKDGTNDAILSAGNTGSLLAAGTLMIGRIKGVERPGLMANLPVLSAEKEVFSFLDVGANSDSKATNINDYATLGTYYAKFVNGIDNPTVGLLNNGSEENKGNEVSKEAHQLLKENSAINFIGNVESRYLLNGVADVVVSDGYTGNAVLKTIEGTALSMVNLVKSAVKDNGIKEKMGGLLLKKSLSNLQDVLDYSKYGGAVLFGVKAPVVKTHGSAQADAVFHTIRQIREMLSSHLIEDLVSYYEKER